MVMGPQTLLLGMAVLVALVRAAGDGNTKTCSTSTAKSTILAMIITTNATKDEKGHNNTKAINHDYLVTSGPRILPFESFH